MKPKWLDRGLLAGPYLMLCLKKPELEVQLARMKVDSAMCWPGPDAAKCVILQQNTKLTCFVCLDNVVGRHVASIVGLIVHESTHMLQDVYKFIGENNPGKEIAAYHAQNVVQILFEELERRVVIKKGIVKGFKVGCKKKPPKK